MLSYQIVQRPLPLFVKPALQLYFSIEHAAFAGHIFGSALYPFWMPSVFTERVIESGYATHLHLNTNNHPTIQNMNIYLYTINLLSPKMIFYQNVLPRLNLRPVLLYQDQTITCYATNT